MASRRQTCRNPKANGPGRALRPGSIVRVKLMALGRRCPVVAETPPRRGMDGYVAAVRFLFTLKQLELIGLTCAVAWPVATAAKWDGSDGAAVPRHTM